LSRMRQLGLMRFSHWSSAAGNLQQELRRSRAKGVEHSPNVPRLLCSCDGLVAFLFERMSPRIPPLRLFRRHIIRKNALVLVALFLFAASGDPSAATVT